MAIQKRNSNARLRGWVVLFFVITFVLGNLLHSQLPAAGSAQAYASSVEQDGELPGQAHNQSVRELRGRSPPKYNSDACGTCPPGRDVFAHKRAPAAATDFPSVVLSQRRPAPTETHLLET
ncbi:MAG: hypothetical protein Q8L53_13190 [Aestuariivirga sp.]|nr:hypothetical protein [Aestuariivirga sp.]